MNRYFGQTPTSFQCERTHGNSDDRKRMTNIDTLSQTQAQSRKKHSTQAAEALTSNNYSNFFDCIVPVSVVSFNT